MLPLHQTLPFVSTALWHGPMWISPLLGSPDPAKHEAMSERFSWTSRSGTTGLTSSSTFDVHGNPAKAACHLLRTFVKVVKQPWQQTQRQQQQKGACDTPWICFIKCSLIWFKHQMNWLWSLTSEGWQKGFQNHSLHRWLDVSRGKSSQILPGKHLHTRGGHCVYSQCLQLSPSGLPWVTQGLCKEDPPPLFILSISRWGQAKGRSPDVFSRLDAARMD